MRQRATWLVMSNIAVFLAGYLAHIVVGRVLGAASYGVFGVVIGLMSTMNLAVTTAVPRATSKHIAEGVCNPWSVAVPALKMQIGWTVAVLVVYAMLAKPLAGALGDDSLYPYILLSAAAIPTYAFCSLLNEGFLNGLRRFGSQALVQSGLAVSRFIFVVLLVFLGFSVSGAVLGYALAPIVGGLLAVYLLRGGEGVAVGSATFSSGRLVKFATFDLVFVLAMFLTYNVDLFFVKALIGTNEAAGWYTAASTLARIPFFATAGLLMAVYPSVSRAYSAEGSRGVAAAMEIPFRYQLMMAFGGAALIGGASSNLVTLVYSSTYISAGIALGVLAIGLGLLAVFQFNATLITAIGKPRVSALLALGQLGVCCVLNYCLIPRMGITGAAIGTSVAISMGTMASGWLCWRQFGELIHVRSLLSISGGAALVWLFLHYVPFPAELLLLQFAISASGLGAIWIACGEIGQEEWNLVKGILGRAKSESSEYSP